MRDAKGTVLREPKDNATEAQNFKWWTVDENEMAGSIAGTVQFIIRHQNPRIEQLVMSTRLYGSTTAYNLMGMAFTRTASIGASASNQRVSFNLCSSVIDTLESKMAKNKVIPTYITNGGKWDAQEKAKNLTKFTQGLFYEQDAHAKLIEMFSDAAVWGDGFIHVFQKDDRVCFERTLPHELLVDIIESMVSEPTQLHRPRIVDRQIALEMYPDLEEQIMTVAPASYQEIGAQGTAADLITVIESWHLKSGPEAKDGLHVITIGDGVLTEEYDKDYFPFVHFRYNKRKLGWYGQGAVERLQNIQSEINRCMILKQRSLWMQGSFKILLENGSKVVTQHLNNEVGTIIHYSNTPPQYVTPPATNPELQQWIDSLIDKGYQQEGVSRLSTTGEAPLGVESGKAMRTLTQIGDDRFEFMGQQLEQAALELARQAVEVAKEIYKDKGSYEVIFPDTTFMETVDWKSIKLDEEEYVLKAYPTSSLSDDLAGRLSETQELAQAGFIDQDSAFDLMDMPDLEMKRDVQNAPRNFLMKKIQQMMETGELYSPEPFDNLQLAKNLALQNYAYAKLHECPEEKLSVLRQFLAQLDDLNAQAQQAMAPPPGAAPMAAPQATPTSDLVPNAANQGGVQ